MDPADSYFLFFEFSYFLVVLTDWVLSILGGFDNLGFGGLK